MLLSAQGHVRQRSFAKLEADDRDLQTAQPLLIDGDEDVDNRSILVLMKRTTTSSAAFALLWLFSLILVSVCTYAFARSSPSSNSFAAGYTTELGRSSQPHTSDSDTVSKLAPQPPPAPQSRPNAPTSTAASTSSPNTASSRSRPRASHTSAAPPPSTPPGPI